MTQTARLMAKGNGRYTGILERVSSGDGCTTYLNLTFQVNSSSQLTMTETGNDGNCDVPAGYEASFTATRKKG